MIIDQNTHITKTGLVKKKWEQYEIDIIKQYYSEWGYKKCQDLLPDRKKVQIIAKADRLGCHRESYSRFKEEAKNKKKCAQGGSTIICFHCQIEKPNSVEYFRDRGGKRKGHKKTTCLLCESKRNSLLREVPRRYLSTILTGIKKRDPETTLTVDILYEMLLKQNSKCNLTGIEMTTTQNKGRVHTNISVDRIDNDKKYTTDNIQLVCLWANTAKNDLPLNDFFELCNKIIKHQSICQNDQNQQV